MASRITLVVENEYMIALMKWADQEGLEARKGAQILIREGLQRRGLLPDGPLPTIEARLIRLEQLLKDKGIDTD